MVIRIAGSSLLPLASLLVLPITVDKPMSCLAKDSGIPILVLNSGSEVENTRHSGRTSCIWSEITLPHFTQIISPESESVIILSLPQPGHLSKELVVIDDVLLLEGKKSP